MTEIKKFPEISVKIVFRCGKEILYHENKSGVRDIPGGHIEFGETIFETLKRELKEELGFILEKEPSLLYVWTYFPKDKSAHRVYIVYLLDLLEKIKFKHKEQQDLKFVWISKEEIKAQKFLPEMENYLLKAIDF